MRMAIGRAPAHLRAVRPNPQSGGSSGNSQAPSPLARARAVRRKCNTKNEGFDRATKKLGSPSTGRRLPIHSSASGSLMGYRVKSVGVPPPIRPSELCRIESQTALLPQQSRRNSYRSRPVRSATSPKSCRDLHLLLVPPRSAKCSSPYCPRRQP
jgi:hypothetical protein